MILIKPYTPGEPIYYIRTDASDPKCAEENKLVYVPLLNAGSGIAASLYILNNGQPPVISTSPNDPDNYLSLFHIKQVTVSDNSLTLDSAAAIEAAMDNGGTDEIWVFANGIKGPGVMGFQPAIFDNKAGQPAWSPFWNHFTVKWADEGKARVLRTSAEIRELIGSGELELFNGVPDSHPNGFVVNCPAPILATNPFSS